MTTFKRWHLLLVALLLLGAIAAKDMLIQPRDRGSDFFAPRAVDRLQAILGDQRPHPVDSAANDAVRDRLMNEIRALGLNPEVHEATDCSDFPKSPVISCSHVRNVIATLAGNPAKKALLLSAHYDSTPTGPGAADDGIGVATILEVASILRHERLDRPVILLFNEGEEFGLNGAAAFVRQDPLANRVGRLINIEARGVSGPAIMFETSNPNGPAIVDYAAVARAPYANSLSADFAKLIPNSTDVVKYKARGWETLNFAIIGNETRYHTPGDDLAHLDPASVKHMGGEVLAAARRFAGPDESASASEQVFTDVGGLFFLHMPLLAGALFLGGLVIVALVLTYRRRAWPALGRVSTAFVAATLAGGTAATLSSFARAGDYWRAHPGIPTLAVAATVLAVLAWLVRRAADRTDRAQLRLAVWTLVLLAGGAASLALPGATIFFLIAPALGLLGLRWRGFAWAGAVVQLIMLGEMVALIQLTLIDGPTAASGPLIALIALPFLVEVGRGADRRSALILAVGAGLLWIGALVMPRATADRPLAFSIDYFRNLTDDKANWAIATKQAPLPGNYPGHWTKGVLPYNQRTRWISEAPKLDVPIATVRVAANDPAGAGRRLRLILSPGGGNAVAIRFAKEAKIVALGLPGSAKSFAKNSPSDRATLRCSGRSCEGLQIEVTLGDRRPVVAEVLATQFALPPEGRLLVAARPRNAIPQYAPDQAITMTRVRL